MYRFHSSTPTKSVMFIVTYKDGRTAYLWSEGHVKGVDDFRVSTIAKEQQEQGLIPQGEIATIRRVH